MTRRTATGTMHRAPLCNSCFLCVCDLVVVDVAKCSINRVGKQQNKTREELRSTA
jgi:hypothetical protein